MKTTYSKDLFDKIDKLKEIEKIIEDNDLGAMFYQLSSKIKYLELYKKFGIYDKVIYSGCTLTNTIDYGIGIYTLNDIPNVGEINEEELLKIGFPTGAYIFGDEYVYDYFEEFFNELQEIKPKYVDELNHTLYYGVDNAKEAYRHYRETFDRYLEGYDEIVRKIKVKELESELKELKG